MTNEELFDDLKQFIMATVSQQTAELTQRMDSLEAKMVTKEDLAATEQRILQSVGDTVSHANDAADERLDDHEKRLRRLEHRAA